MRVLVVQDDHNVASFLKRGLEEAGHIVDLAFSGMDGEYLALLNAYDVLILECQLPDKDGRQVCRDLRAAGKSTPVLLLTNCASTADKILGFNSGADQFLIRPFDFNELMARLRVLGRHSGAIPVREMAVADLKIEPLSRRVRRGEQEVELTTKEYQLLELLVRRAGQVVPRTEIMSQIWNLQHDPTTNGVDVLIKHVRDKVDRGYGQQLIRTVRGVGYTIKGEGRSWGHSGNAAQKVN